MKKHLNKLTFLVLVFLFVGGVVLTVLRLGQYETGQESNRYAQQLAFSDTGMETQPQLLPIQPTGPSEPEETVPETEPAETVIPMDEAARFLQQLDVYSLRQVNPDVLGWIYLPETAISYPLMETDERDQYLDHAWDGSHNAGGSIFLEKNNRRDFTDFNTIIYGHHLVNGTMFQPLMNYREETFFQKHPYVYIVTDREIFRYRLFSAYEAPVDSDTYRLYFPDDAAREAALALYCQGKQDLALTPRDRILTLSTCTGTGVYTTRWVVQGILDAQWTK